MSRSKKEAVEVHGRGLDLALEYIDNEIRELDRRKHDLEQMSERLIAKQDVFERFQEL